MCGITSCESFVRNQLCLLLLCYAIACEKVPPTGSAAKFAVYLICLSSFFFFFNLGWLTTRNVAPRVLFGCMKKLLLLRVTRCFYSHTLRHHTPRTSTDSRCNTPSTPSITNSWVKLSSVTPKRIFDTPEYMAFANFTHQAKPELLPSYETSCASPAECYPV